MSDTKGGCKYQIVVTDEDGNPVDSFPITRDMTHVQMTKRIKEIHGRFPTATIERRSY
jgi:hypothetical protein